MKLSKIIMRKIQIPEMKKKRRYVVPGVLQFCEVTLEESLLGLSKTTEFSDVETTGQQVTMDTTDNNTDWTTGSYFD